MWVGVSHFYRDRAGATALEYAWIASLISIVAYASMHYMGGWVANVFIEAANNLTAP